MSSSLRGSFGSIHHEGHAASTRRGDVSESAEGVVRAMLAAWENADVETLTGFFSENALVEDPRGSQHGIEAIRKQFAEDIAMTPSTSCDIRKLLTDGSTVMAERVDSFTTLGHPLTMDVVGVFDVDVSGRITRWHEYFDIQSLTAQMELGL
jgi:limonene-1,2-epoxide hydrolase